MLCLMLVAPVCIARNGLHGSTVPSFGYHSRSVQTHDALCSESRHDARLDSSTHACLCSMRSSADIYFCDSQCFDAARSIA